MTDVIKVTIAYERDEDDWIVAKVLEVPGAISQGRTREQARANALGALRLILTPDDEESVRNGARETVTFTRAT